MQHKYFGAYNSKRKMWDWIQPLVENGTPDLWLWIMMMICIWYGAGATVVYRNVSFLHYFTFVR